VTDRSSSEYSLLNCCCLCTILCHSAVTLQHMTVQHMTVQHMTVQHMTVQHMTVQHMTVQHMTLQHMTVQYTNTLGGLQRVMCGVSFVCCVYSLSVCLSVLPVR
jgi:hypothetical protein